MKTKEDIMNEYGLNDKQALVVIDDSKELIVPAGAGSGKTKTLVTKVVNLLKDGKSLDAFLVLTFTKKAATEMKERIKKDLKKAHLIQLANKIDSSNISTFDAFAYNYVKQNASLIGLDSNIELLDQAVFMSTKKKIVSEIMLDIMLNEKSSSLYTFIETFTDKTNEESFILDVINVYEKLTESKKIDDIKPEALILQEKLFDSESLRKRLEDISLDFVYSNEEMLEEIFVYSDYLDKVILEKPLFEGKKSKWKEVSVFDKKKIEKILKPYKDLFKTQPMVEDIDFVYQTEIEYAKNLIDFLKRYEEKLDFFKQETNKYEFNDIANFLNEILKNNKSTLERLKERFKYVFVDEYQDTSSIQSEFLEMLIKDNEDIHVLYVGDIKQSIYKFRNAKPETFIKKLETIKSITLSTNYRSSKKIIDFVNGLFVNILDNKEKYDIDYKDNHHMESGSKAYDMNDTSSDVFLEELYTEDEDKSKNDPVEEAFVIGHKIKELIKEKKLKDYKDAAILLRNKQAFKVFKDVFKYLDIPLQVQVDQRIKSSYLLKLMANILALSLEIKETTKENYKDKRFNYFSIARSELFRYDDFKLFNQLIDSTNLKNNKKLEIEKEIWDKCYKVYEAIYTKTNYEIVDTMVKEFQIYEKIIYATKKEDKEYQIEYLYNISKTLSDLNIIGEDFVKYIYQLAYDDNINLSLTVLQDQEENSVRLTNIHQSKGLEYETLFVCGLNKKFSGNKIKKFKYSEESKLLLQAKFKDTAQQITYDNILQMIKNKGLEKEKASALKEEMRLLYVASTRPKKALYLITTRKSDYSNLESFTDYLYENNIESLIKKENIRRHTEFLKQNDYYKKLRDTNEYYPKQIDNLVDDSFKFNSYEQEEPKASLSVNRLIENNERQNLKKGTLLHETYEYATLESNIPKIKKFNQTIFAGKNLKDALQIHKELEFMYTESKILYKGIIDMVVVYENEVHIIDYKTNDISVDKYKNQLESYEKYIRLIYPNKEIKKFLYSMVKEELKEVK
ncbi:ATP-dependent helicase/nuclease subunit A [Alteracholeplasma palmae J233]|uniref:DNA 3'-5' helicase n=1 Tax=Alteracholeplasma palmae (strain ATCC 49389 / J233) TaxID=1318466 RepID=U4KK68_ALTPJ|nr:UvrD-helicase domain-containing protein [Alteracholeplasma palmae]CCV63922.1 ATP-dependent helicase/nuclease subunit A [Alteracholeplasma palmae J233]